MDNAERLELADQFLENFRATVRATRVIFRHEVERHGVTWPQYGMLRMVKRQGPVTITELSSLLNITLPTASKMIDILCSKGMLERAKDQEDHRVTNLKLTASSLNLLKKINKQQSEMIAEAFGDADQAELESFTEMMKLLADHLLALVAKWKKPQPDEG